MYSSTTVSHLSGRPSAVRSWMKSQVQTSSLNRAGLAVQLLALTPGFGPSFRGFRSRIGRRRQDHDHPEAVLTRQRKGEQHAILRGTDRDLIVRQPPPHVDVAEQAFVGNQNGDAKAGLAKAATKVTSPTW